MSETLFFSNIPVKRNYKLKDWGMGWPRNVGINIIFGEYLYGECTVDSWPQIHVYTKWHP